MKFPDFQDFLATQDSNTISAILRDANNGAKLVRPEMLNDPQSVPGLAEYTVPPWISQSRLNYQTILKCSLI